MKRGLFARLFVVSTSVFFFISATQPFHAALLEKLDQFELPQFAAVGGWMEDFADARMSGFLERLKSLASRNTPPVPAPIIQPAGVPTQYATSTIIERIVEVGNTYYPTNVIERHFTVTQSGVSSADLAAVLDEAKAYTSKAVDKNMDAIDYPDVSDLFGSLAAGDLLIIDVDGNGDTLSAGNTGTVLQIVDGMPTWVATSTLGFLEGTSLDTSAEIAALVTDETGTGEMVFNTDPLLHGFRSDASSTIAELTISGDLTVLGNSLTLGANVADTITVNASVGSNLIPTINATYDIGSPSYYWDDAYFDTITVNNISAASTSIAGTQSSTFTLNSDNASSDVEDMNLIFFRGVVVPNALLSWRSTQARFEFNQPLFIQNQSSNTTTVPTLSLRGSTGQTGNILEVASSTGTQYLTVSANGRIGIGTTTPSSAVTIAGTDAIRIPVGTTAQRPSTALVGQVRYNTTAAQFEGYGASGAWQGLGGVVDIDQDTYITAEQNPDDDTLRFYTAGNERLTISSTGTVTFSAYTGGVLVTSPSGLVSASTTIGAGYLDASVILASEIDTLAEIETLAGGINILQSTEIDTSSELATLLTDETGTGSVVFSVSPTFTGTATFANIHMSPAGTSTLGYASTTGLTVAGNSYLLGNVGVGTTTTNAKLAVSGSFSQSLNSTSLTLAGTRTSLSGANGVFVAGKYAYVANEVGDSLAIVDISNPANPTLVGSTQGPTPGTSLNGAKHVFVSGKYAYVASGIRGLAIIDISNPANPTFVSEETATISGADSVFVSGRYAYVADGNSLATFDISDPTDPVLVSDVGGTAMNGANSVFVSGRYAYVANQTRDSLAVIDIGNPASSTFMGETQGTTPGTTLNGAHGVFVSGNYAYVATIDRGSLAIIDISDPSNPTFVSEIQDSTLLASARNVFVSGNYAFVTAANRSALALIDISDPSNPTFVDELQSLIGVNGVYVSGRYAYTANYAGNSLSVIDIGGSDIASARIGALETGTANITDMLSVGNSLLVGTGLNVGQGGIATDGALSVFSTTTASYFGGSLGIGTTSPSHKLSVVGDINLTGSLYQNGVLFAGSKWTSSGSDIYYNTGSVGIGTSSPSSKLTVIGDAKITAATNASSTFQVKNSSSDTVFQVSTLNSAANILSIASSTGSSYFDITAGGYAGIGTSTPTAQLHTTGTVRFSNFGLGTLQTDANGNLSVSSDERLKVIEGKFSSTSVEALLGIEPIKYRWATSTGYDTTTLYTGFSAQNVKDFIPEAVGEDKNGFLTLSDRPLLATVINAIKEIWAKLMGHDTMIQDLERENQELESRVRVLEETLGVEPPAEDEEEVPPPEEDEEVPPGEDGEEVPPEEGEEEPGEGEEVPPEEGEEVPPEGGDEVPNGGEENIEDGEGEEDPVGEENSDDEEGEAPPEEGNTGETPDDGAGEGEATDDE